jgi:hypothetical protein
MPIIDDFLDIPPPKSISAEWATMLPIESILELSLVEHDGPR